DLSGAVEGTSRRSPGAASLPLQLRETSPCIEIWTESQNTSLAGRVDQQNADVERDLLIEAAFSGVEEYRIRALRLSPTGHLRWPGTGSGGLATIDDGMTPESVALLGLPDWRIMISLSSRESLAKSVEILSHSAPQACFLSYLQAK